MDVFRSIVIVFNQTNQKRAKIFWNGRKFWYSSLIFEIVWPWCLQDSRQFSVLAQEFFQHFFESPHEWIVRMIALSHWFKNFSWKVANTKQYYYQIENSNRFSGNMIIIFNLFICPTNRTHKNLSKSINEHKFSFLSVMFSFTLPTLVNILKNTVQYSSIWRRILRICVPSGTFSMFNHE